jgi:hypothetical protein
MTPADDPDATGGATLPPPPPEPTPESRPGSSGRSRFVLLVALAVVAVAGVAGGMVALSGRGQKRASVPSPTISPELGASPTVAPPPLAAVSLVAEADSLPIGVRLSWLPPSGGTEVDGFRIYRGDQLVASLSGGATDYFDTDVTPGKQYTYSVESRSGTALKSPRVSVEIEVPVPALKDAQVAGIFNVTLTPSSQYGYGNTLRKATTGWNLKSKCGTEACDVTLKVLQSKDLKVGLHRAGATYTGRVTDKFGTTCSGVAVVSTVTIKIRVVRAKAISGEWRATKLEGTLKQAEASQLGCGSSGVTYATVVKLLVP